MTIATTAGAKLYIGVAKEQKTADFVRADFSAANAATWKEIGELEGLGSLGDTANAVNFTSIGANRQRTLKGARSAGTMEVVAGIDYADEGQQAAIAAEKTIHDYEFRLVLNDAPAGGTPSERLFIAKVMSQAEQFDAADNVMMLNISLGVNSNIVRIDAEEA
jgi:hypothetical protein